MNTKLRIGGSLLVGILLIAAAFVFGNPSSASIPEGAVVIVPQGTREYQETRDTDGDGMRDWEEELRATDPLVPDAPPSKDEAAQIYGLASTTEELPDTVTNRFARSFFEKYFSESISSEGVEAAAKQALIDGSIDSVTKEVSDTFFTRADIHTSSNTSISDMRMYGNELAKVYAGNTVKNENEVLILERALQTDNAEELKALDPIVASYKDIIQNLLRISAPEKLVNEHLNLLNTALAIHNDVVAMRNSFEDPLPALIRIKRYENDAIGLYYAIDNMRTAFEREGVVYTEGEPGLFFFSFRP